VAIWNSRCLSIPYNTRNAADKTIFPSWCLSASWCFAYGLNVGNVRGGLHAMPSTHMPPWHRWNRSNKCMQMHTVTHSRRMQNNTCEIRESQYGWRLRGETWMRRGYILCCTWLWAKYADMQTFKACTFFVHHCIWQALHKEETHTSSHKKGLVLKPWNHTSTCRAFTSHETAAQNTRRYVLKTILRCSWTLGRHIRAWSLGAYQFFAQKKSVNR
jgi:hypothetical protein